MLDKINQILIKKSISVDFDDYWKNYSWVIRLDA